MNVLVACEESQRVCEAFRKRGHIAFSCDTLEPSGGHPEWHIQADVIPLLNGNCAFTTLDGVEHYQDGKWDMIVAFPPCTYLSNAGAARLYPKAGQLNKERYAKGVKAKEFFMQFYNADCQSICIENPIPTRIYNLPHYTQTIQPYEHGHPYSKKLVCGCAVCLYSSPQKPLSLYALGYQAAVKTAKATNAKIVVRKSATQKPEAKPSPALQKLWLNNGDRKRPLRAATLKRSSPNITICSLVNTLIIL